MVLTPVNYSRRSPFVAQALCVLFLLLSFATAAKEVTEPVWIDVRSWVEHQTDSIEGDPRYHFTDILESVSLAYPDKETPIKLYCAVGGRAGKALATLQEAGYTNVENAGGINDVRIARGLDGAD